MKPLLTSLFVAGALAATPALAQTGCEPFCNPPPPPPGCSYVQGVLICVDIPIEGG